MAAPSGLAYAQTSISAVTGTAIQSDTPTVTGTVSGYSVSPALPAGLALDATSGAISGTPTSPAAQASYTVTAANGTGSTTASVQITVVSPPPPVTPPSGLAYAQASLTGEVGQPIATDVPAVAGQVTTFAVAPALPAGLQLDAASGAIVGTPTAAAAQASYTVTASNAGGSTTTQVSLTVNPAVTTLLDLGHGTGITGTQLVSTRALTQDASGHWVLWNYATAAELANGNVAFPANTFAPSGTALDWPIAMAGTTIGIGVANGIESRSAADGHLVAILASSMLDSLTDTKTWWQLASDGSYFCAGSKNGLTAWSPTGQVLFSKTGDYSSASAFAAPGEIQIAVGAAGNSVIETVAVASGASTVSPAFSGQFLRWFTDGSQFLTGLGGTVWEYTNTGTQEAILSSVGTNDLGGEGQWIWSTSTQVNGAQEEETLSFYPVGSGTAAVSFTVPDQATIAPSGTTVGVLSVSQVASVIDLSGAAPVKTDTSLSAAVAGQQTGSTQPPYAAVSASQWILGNDVGVVADGTTLNGTPRLFDYGAALSIAGAEDRVAVATAGGSLLYFDPTSNSQEGNIAFLSSKIALSQDGATLAAEEGGDSSALPPSKRTLNIYSLPGANVIESFTYAGGASAPSLLDFTLSGGGTTLGQLLANQPTCSQQVSPIAGTPLIWSRQLTASMCASDETVVAPAAYPDAIHLSPDGTLIAVSTGATIAGTTNIYQNGQLSNTVTGIAVDWLDNSRLLVNTFMEQAEGQGLMLPVYATAVVDGAAGNQLATAPISEIDRFQAVDADHIYAPDLNSILSLTDGSLTWTSPLTSTKQGAIAGNSVVFASGSRVVTSTY